LLWDRVQQNFGKPESCLAVIAPTLTMREDDRIRQIVEEERERDPENAAREFDCVPLGQGTGLFYDSSALKAAEDSSLPLVTLPPRGERIIVGCGVDTGLVSDSSAAVVCHRVGNVYTLAEIVELRPNKGNPLKLSDVCTTYAHLMRRHGVRIALADHHELEASKEHLAEHRVSLEAAPSGNQGKFEVYQATRSLLNEGNLRIPSGMKKLIRQLREVHSKPLPGGGLRIWSPRNKSGHGDLASAAVLAIYHATSIGTTRLVPRRRPASTSRWSRPHQRGF
jgi:hypothetical protein